jgi:hypothetical protein
VYGSDWNRSVNRRNRAVNRGNRAVNRGNRAVNRGNWDRGNRTVKGIGQ